MSSEQRTHGAPTTPDGRTTLVIGGTGKTGRRVAERLTARGLPVRIGSRSARSPFRWESPATWDAALDGAGAAYLTYYPDLGFPGAAETVGAFARTAVGRGVRRLVLLSGRGEEGAHRSEEAVRASGADLTVVRASWFAQNFDEGTFVDAVRAGEIAFPAGDAVEPFVDADDIADVVVAALTDDRHVGRTYELSGPRLLNFTEVAAELTRAVGREVRYVPVTRDDFRAVLEGAGLPLDFLELVDLLTDGRNAHVVHGVEEVLGRPARDFSAYARDAAARGTWKE
ncbi:NmrA family NAD(P)-binding protein [Streptomyces sp. NPDC127068]|uniref:NmrA family NAD(P)-binding protein n=1 Tax=Streptomyces sp. NPDC127068 TaxID=3347127 RepID=UPI0036560623